MEWNNGLRIRAISIHEDEDADENADEIDSFCSEDDINIREKNREHAKNTRKRKKAYVDDLLEAAQSFSLKMDDLARFRLSAFSALSDQVSSRFKLLEVFLVLYGQFNATSKVWWHILDPDIKLIVPFVPIFWSHPNQVANGRVIYNGVAEVLSGIQNSLQLNKQFGLMTSENLTALSFRFVPEKSSFQGNVIFSALTYQSNNAVFLGARNEIKLLSMLRCEFSPGNRVTELELIFDTKSLIGQLQEAFAAGLGQMVSWNRFPLTAKDTKPKFPHCITTIEPPCKMIESSANFRSLFCPPNIEGIKQEFEWITFLENLHEEKLELASKTMITDVLRSYQARKSTVVVVRLPMYTREKLSPVGETDSGEDTHTPVSSVCWKLCRIKLFPLYSLESSLYTLTHVLSVIEVATAVS